MTNMDNNAPKNDFRINPNFDLPKLSSSDPSKTMSINPNEPKTGKKSEKSGRWIPRNSVTWCNNHPNRSNNITEGIFVFEADKSNK